MSDFLTLASVIIALAAAFYAYMQAKNAEKSNHISQQIAYSDAIIHFTDRFLNLLEKGHPANRLIKDADWTNQFWSLHATEFYFFHHGLLPTFMYSLWMADLANLYVGSNGLDIRQSHEQYLKTYSLQYEKLLVFFQGIYELATAHDDEITRNNELAKFIQAWFSEHKESSLTKQPTNDS